MFMQSILRSILNTASWNIKSAMAMFCSHGSAASMVTVISLIGGSNVVYRAHLGMCRWFVDNRLVVEKFVKKEFL
jgi:hypothetical protein